MKLGNHVSQIHFWTLFSDAPTPQCIKTIVSEIQGSPTHPLFSADIAFSWKCSSVPRRTCLPFSFPSPFLPSSLPPFLQHSNSPVFAVFASVRMIWGPRSAVGRVASDIIFVVLTLWCVSAFPWLFWEHLKDCNHSTHLPCGHMECVLHRLLMRCMRGGCFA